MRPELLLRLYPRHWRARYEDEMRALLAETSVTPAVVFDLLLGATREWIRTLTVAPGPPLSTVHERWRNFGRTSFLTLAMASTSWYLAQLLRGAGIKEHDWLWLFAAPSLVVMLRTFSGMGRRSKFQYPGLKNGEVVPSEGMANPGIGPREFWISIAAYVIGLTVWWIAQLDPDRWVGSLRQIGPYLNWFLLYQQMSMLRSRTKTVLARARQVHLIEAARLRAVRPPSPWS